MKDFWLQTQNQSTVSVQPITLFDSESTYCRRKGQKNSNGFPTKVREKGREKKKKQLTMGVSLMLRWGKGSLELTCTGARGAPITPNNSLRSDLLYDIEVTEGARESCPLIHCPRPDPTLFESPNSPPSGSGPSINGVNASPTGLKLPDLAIKASGCATWLWCFFLLSRAAMGEPDLAGLLERERDGESPRTTSSFRAEKNPCFFSINKTIPQKSKNDSATSSLTTANCGRRSPMEKKTKRETMEERSMIWCCRGYRFSWVTERKECEQWKFFIERGERERELE